MDTMSVFDSINFALDDLGVDGTDRFSEDDGGFTSSKFGNTCLLLIGKLSQYDNRIILPADATVKSIYDSIKVREPHFPVDASDMEYRLMRMLCTHLQGERLYRHSSKGDARRDQAGETGKTVFQLEKICNDLDIDTATENVATELAILSLVSETVSKIASTLPPGVISSPPRVLPHISPSQLTPEQHLVLQSINQAFLGDFLLRRRMLMKRLDVTIQAFLWGEKAQGKEGEVVAAIQAQRRHLTEQPTSYSVEDALRSPISLLHEHSKRVTDTGSRGKKNLVKTVIIGHIPDRGGRANEMRPKKSDFGFGGGGFGGGGRGGGRGGRGNKGGGGGGRKS